VKSTALLAALGGLLIAGALAAAIVLGSGNNGREPATARSTPNPTVSQAPEATPPAAPSTPGPRATPLADRTACAEIQGTPYRSQSERAFYLANCIQSQSAATTPSLATDSSASCVTDVQIQTTRSDATFNVSGTTVEQINASIQANGPVVDGEVASGLTQYNYGLQGSFCTRSGACTLGAMTISADVVVTLPVLTTRSALSADIGRLWDDFAERVRVHENRHVTILEEGLTEIRRQLLLLEAQPSCDVLDHEVDKVWLFAMSQVNQRQDAFHAADRAGAGGTVVR
jgi:predicted secreted Zn-dependent protease